MLVVMGRIIDGTGREPISDGVVVIDGNRILRAGPRKELDIEIPKDTTIIDAKRGVIMPGLIDAHIHLTGGKDLNWINRIITPEPVRIMRSAFSIDPLIDAGFTTVRDVGGYGIYIKQLIAEGTIRRGPRIFSAYRVISQTFGHGDIHSLPLDFVRSYGFSRICDGADECRKAAREILREGADLLKICTTGGVLSERDLPQNPQFTIEEIKAVVEEARRVGTYVAAHAQGTEGIKNALIAGVRTIEHGIYLDDEAIEMFLKKGAYLVPTLSIVHQIVREGEKYKVPEHGIRKAKMVIEDHIKSVRRAKEAGVKIATGTDFSNVPMLEFGRNAMELELLVKLAGFTPMEAIVAATKTAAEAIMMGDKIGTLEEGKLADVIVVKCDPLADITCLKPENTPVVIRDGVIQKLIADQVEIRKGGTRLATSI